MLKISIFLLAILPQFICAQSIVSGPFQGHTTFNSTKVWFLGKSLERVNYKVTNLTDSTDIHTGSALPETSFCFKNKCPFKFKLDGLSEGATYRLEISRNNQLLSSGKIKTIKNYDVDDFSFLIGSCAFIGTGKDHLYKLWNSTRIFNTLAKEEEGDFMLWMGDNVYLMGNELTSKKNALKRYIRVRKHKKLNRFMKKKFHYAIWDDHDFGPNNCDGNFAGKENSKAIFETFWQNPNDPHQNGIYYRFKYADIEIFMLDDRYNREDLNEPKKMLGSEQLAWLKKGLEESNASFKVIVSGNQVLNKVGGHESFSKYETEKKELFDFIREATISGIMFFSGDRHHSEILKVQIPHNYPLYDFTCSALTSWRYPWRKMSKERNNENRVGELILNHNYAVITISGIEHQRIFTITFKNKFGKTLHQYTVRQQEISF